MYRCNEFHFGSFNHQTHEQMSFTQAHKKVLEKHRHYWDSLRTVGFMRNLDKPVFDELQQVHNEAIAVQHFTHWCGECVADMVRILYTQFDKQQVVPAEAAPAEPEKKSNRKQRRHGQQQPVSGQ